MNLTTLKIYFPIGILIITLAYLGCYAYGGKALDALPDLQSLAFFHLTWWLIVILWEERGKD